MTTADDALDAAARLLPSPRGAEWRWEDDELTRDLVRELQSGEAHETRAFLRPIFKRMKGGVRKNGQKNDELVERAFAFVDWMVELAQQGDAARAIPVLAKLQPSYALNTIVTSSQRTGSLAEARRAFELIAWYGYEPDVFTYTALIDVTARSGDVQRAIEIYEEMRATRSRPNIVTFTTVIRAVAFTTSVQAIECLRFLAHAREEETFDEALYLDALETCAVRQAMIAASAVLRDITLNDVTLRNSERLVAAIAKLVEKRADKDVLLTEWLQDGIVTQHEVDQIGVAAKATPSRVDGPKSLGALGNQTSDSVRLAVVQHDISRLTERIANGSMVSTNDFETLIHQCRKRKWKEEVDMIIQAMRKLATEGWEIPSGSDDLAPTVLPAQPHLMPNSKTFVSVVDSYLVAGDEPLAWKAFQEVGERDELTREQALYRKYVRGCYLLTDCTHIQEVLKLALEDGIMFTNRMCLELARMHGYRHQEGIDVVLNQIPLGSREKKQQYMEELVTSCAYKHNTQGVVDTIEVLPAHGLSRSAKTEMAVFICCLQYAHHKEAREMMQFFQDKQLLLDIPMYDSLLREMYFKYTRRGGVFDESSRGVAMRTLQMRKSLFDAAFREREALEEWAKSAYHLEYRAKFRAWHEHNDETEAPCAMTYWCQLHALECAPLMFTQHVVEVITTIRDKESKIAKQQLIREALQSTPDPFLFNLRAVTALRALDLTYRGQGKLSKQMLTILAEAEPQPHHVEYCLNQLDVLTVHIVKELDDVMQLHQYDQQRILDFCMDALETENVDKTIGYLISREALYTVDTARFFTPKFAELYVLHGVVTILQFFRPDVEHSTEMKRQFLREVIDVESLSDEDEESASALPLTRRAIFEFKLEHDSEFMPIIMMPPPERQYASATASVVDESLFLQLPLPESQVVIVDQDESLATAYDIMMQPSVHRIGIDAEWRPDARGYAQSKCSLLQIACDTHVFLFDLMELSISDLEELFSHLFSSPSILKLGFALDGDIKRLQWSFPDVTCFSVVENVLDFNHDELPGETALATGETDDAKQQQEEEIRAAKKRRRHRGLSAFTQEILGAPLNKSQQKSDWEKRPLSPQQLKYAALDAYCLLMLHDRVSHQQQAHSGDGAI